MANTKNFIAKNGFSTGDGYSMPDIRPSLLLDFANSKTLDPRITFTRGSTATYWDGHTTAKAEENLHQYSQSTTGKASFDFTVTNNAATAPDGTTTATLLTADSSGTGGPRYYGVEDTGGQRAFTSGVTYTVSAYFKAGTTTYCYISMRTTSANIASSEFNLSTGSASTASATGTWSNASSTMTDVGNGWYRCTVTATAGATVSSGFNFFGVSDGTGISSGGYPDITLSGQTVYIWGLQKEERSSATAYTATTSSPIVKYQPTLQTAASGEARFDHNPVTGESKGLLIEESRTSLIWPSTLDSSWSNPTTMHHDNYDIAPDGTHTAGLIYESITARQQLVSKVSTSVVSGSTYIFSVFVKPYTWDGDVEIHAFGDSSTSFDIGGEDFTASDGSKGMYSVGNGWKRIWWKRTKSNTTGTFYLGFSGNSYAGQGYAKAFLAWGFDLALGSYPTSYIPTSGSSVTRSAESAYIGVDSWYPYNSGGTVLVEGRVAEVSSDNMYLEGSLNGSGIYDISVTAAQTRSQFINRYVNASNDMRSPTSSISAGELVRLVGAWSATETSSYLDGSSTTSIANQSFSVGANRIYFGSRNGSSLFMNDALKRVAFYPQRLSDATLQAMTEE